MKQVGVYEAKTHLPRLLDEVERGDTVTITRHGRPVAKLVPVDVDRQRIKETIEEIKRFPKIKLEGITIRGLIEEGRRY